MRIIAHLDMDAFFAAVEERDRPRLKGKPIVVGADPLDGRGRGVVATANYRAREYGIRSALPIGKAWEFSEIARKAGKPPVVFVSGSHRTYAEVSRRIMAIISKYSSVVDPVSIDEAFFDLSGCGSYEAAKRVAQKIKNDIRQNEQLTASIGIGPNKLVAKIASDLEKPDGLTVVPAENVEKVFSSLSIRKIPGIGPRAESLLHRKNIRTVADGRQLALVELEKLFGKWGSSLYRKFRGLDDSPLGEPAERKSIGEQETFAEDTAEANFLTARLTALAGAVFRRFERSGFRNFRTIVVTVRFRNFRTVSRSKTFPTPVSDLKGLRFEALRLLLPFLESGAENRRREKIRLLGVRIEKLSGLGTLPL